MKEQTTTTLASLSQLTGLLQHYNGKFVWFDWESSQDDRMSKTLVKEGAPAGSRKKADREPNPMHGKTTKRMMAVMRNNFSFKNRALKEAAAMGADVPADWTPQARSWGEHVPGTPLVLHESKKDGVNRVYSHFLPIKYHASDLTGYYVDGKRVEDQKGFKAQYIKPDSKPKDKFGAARKAAHPVNARLDNTLFVRMGENTYQLPGHVSIEEIEEIAALVAAYGEQKAAA